LGLGNYTWLGGEDNLIQLQRYLADVTETAVEIKQLGWQKQGFYSFCNGALEDGEWHEIDEYGIVRLGAGNYYLPAMSSIYKNSPELYSNERKFRHLEYSSISLRDYFTKILAVHGDNAMVGLSFFIASLFRDIVVKKSRGFPLLNLFGPKGSGKTELGHSLMSFFVNENDPLGMVSDSLPALSDAVASTSNALVQIDEYSNGIDIKKLEWLKGLWGGLGRSKMNIDTKNRERARVDSGIILTGQEMPTADIALFHRVIYLTYDRQHHNQEERDRWKDLCHDRLMGATHITLEILSHRDKFESSFGEAWKKAEIDLSYRLRGYEIQDRIEKDWTVPLAAYLAIADSIDVPFRYDDLLNFCVKGVIRQNDVCSSADEVAGFWRIISSAQQKGLLMNEQDFVIKTKRLLRTNVQELPLEFEENRQILMFRKDIMLATYRELGKKMDEKILSPESILHYLQISPEYLGVKIQPERFKRFGSNGLPIQEPYMEDGKSKLRIMYQRDRPLCFHYKLLSDKFGIILDTYMGQENEEPEEPVQPELFEESVPF
ncbi:MAG: DNA primase, partial [Bacteroidales bacterium]|nr:DNA primase [Bacteroidales bacterium]